MTDLSSCLHDAPIGICRVTHDRKTLAITDFNAVFEIMAGVSAKGRLLDDILVSKEGMDLCKKLKSPSPPTEAVIPIGARWVAISITTDADIYTLFMTDISSIKAAIVQADAAAAQKSNFLATISHEIRTPMQSVYGLLEMIELEPVSSDISAMVKTAKQSSSNLLEILDEVLEFAKMDADQMELDHFEVPVRTLCRGIIEALEVKVSGKDVILREEVSETVPFVIVGDPKRLRQILINLTGNALKFTKEGIVTIRVTRDVQEISSPSKGLALRFEIVDTGIGMSADVTQKLFQPFVQADNSTARKYGGTGLGLSICKKLVELMGGRIGVTSVTGKGSTFWFEIPTEEVDVNATILDLPKLDGISILSVEDHPLGAKEIQKSLRSMGATVEHCGTIKDALALIKRRPFDVGIFDQGLPDGLGIDLVRQTIELRPFMGLVMYTARDDSGLQHTLQSLGVGYIAKPASRIGLGEAVREAASKVSKMEIGSGPRRLLIAEDTASVRDVLQRQLDKLGVEATFAEDGEQALAGIRSGQYGILFTDLHMPKLDGYAVVRSIREDDEKLDRHFPIIALTADVQMTQRQVYMSHGFDECLLKPVSLGHFRRLLIRWGLLKEGTETVSAQATSSIHTTAIDHEAVIAQMGSFDDSVIEMLKMFADMTAPLVERIEKAQAQKDYKELKEAAHSLKGAARSACASKLGDLAAKLQDNAEAHIDSSPLIKDILIAFDDVRTEINSL